MVGVAGEEDVAPEALASKRHLLAVAAHEREGLSSGTALMHDALQQTHLVVQPRLPRGHTTQLLELGPRPTQLVLEVVQRLL